MAWSLRFAICATTLSLAGVTGPVWARPAGAAPAFDGAWRNPRNTVHLDLRACGVHICGHVIWATEAAKTAAARFRKNPLVGQQLFREFTVGDDGTARGKVFVPDLGLTFRGDARHIDPDTVKVKGCVIGNLVCKSQIWTRLPVAPP